MKKEKERKPTMTVAIDKELIARLDIEAQKQNRSRSNLLEQIVRAYFNGSK